MIAFGRAVGRANDRVLIPFVIGAAWAIVSTSVMW